MEESRKARRSMKFMNARKSNMAEIAQETSKDLSDKTDDDSIEISAIESMDTSGTSEVTANSKSKLVPGNPVKPSAITTNNKVAAATKLGQNRSNLNVVNNRNNLKPVPNNKLPFSQTVSQKDETRREQLLKWKKEKEAADMTSRKTQKQPFKVGVVLGTKPINGSDTSTANNTTNKNSKNLLSGSTTSVPSRNGGVAAPRVPPVTTSRKPMTAGTTASDIPAGDARRITRAMSKVTTNTGITAVKSTTQVMKPAVDKMKTLSIADKGTTSRPVTASSTVSKSGPSSQPTKPSQTSSSSKKPLDPVPNKKPIAAQGRTINGVKGNKPVPKGVSESASKTQSTTTTTPNDNEKNVPVAASTEQKPVEVKPKKKLKPQAIDATYINYNSQFSNACLTLKSYSTEWTAILEQLEQQKEEMQEEILGDIHSALGKVKLLLQSKLPQFGELLYSYLCQETDPRPILPCDLEGWWDVAAIQLEAIDKEFKGLQALRQNKWLKVLPVSAPQEINHGNNEKEANKPTAPIRRAKPNPVKTQASAALRAFLAN
ncbi:Disks large-associated protein 1, partial [Orchesella cincta]